MYREEIKALDSNWINLKQTYNPKGDNFELQEAFEKEYGTLSRFSWGFLPTSFYITRGVNQII